MMNKLPASFTRTTISSNRMPLSTTMQLSRGNNASRTTNRANRAYNAPTNVQLGVRVKQPPKQIKLNKQTASLG